MKSNDEIVSSVFLNFFAFLIIIFVAVVIRGSIDAHKAQLKSIESQRKLDLAIKNAQCRVLRENDSDLIGKRCTKLKNGNVSIITLTDMEVEAHPSRVIYKEENELLKPYRYGK